MTAQEQTIEDIKAIIKPFVPQYKRLHEILSQYKSYHFEEAQGDERFIIVGNRGYSRKAIADHLQEVSDILHILPKDRRIVFLPASVNPQKELFKILVPYE